MSTEQNKAVLRRFSEMIFDEKNLDRAEQIVGEDYVDHGALPGQAPGLVGAKRKWASFIAATPDMRVTIDDMVAEGDRVAVRWTYDGTHQGDLIGIPPTGRHFQIGGMSICRVEAGRMVEQWEQFDTFGLLQQLGVIPRREQESPMEPKASEAGSGSGRSSMSSTPSSTSAEANKTSIRRFYQEVLNERRLDRADEFVAQDYVDNGALPGQGPGLQGAKHRWTTYFAAIPDMHATIDDLVAEGDRVVVRWTAEGTHQGTLMGVAATGKRFRVGGISIYRLVDGKQVEQWEQADTLGLMYQLGVIHPPEAHEARAA